MIWISIYTAVDEEIAAMLEREVEVSFSSCDLKARIQEPGSVIRL